MPGLESPPQSPPNFNYSATAIIAETGRIIENTRQLQAHLVASISPDHATFKNVLLPLANDENETIGLKKLFKFFNSTSPSVELRDASETSVKLFADAEAEIYTRDDLFNLINAVFVRGEELDPESQFYLEHKHREFVRNGFEIEAGPKRNRFGEIKKRIQSLELDYRKCLNASSGLWFTPQELDGLSSHVLQGLDVREEDGKLWLPLRKPHLELAMKFLKSEVTRKRVYVGYDRSCLDNIPRLKEIIVLRDEAARLLGFSNHAEFKIQDKMVQSTHFIEDAIQELRDSVTPLAKLEIERLLQLKRVELQERTNEKDETKPSPRTETQDEAKTKVDDSNKDNIITDLKKNSKLYLWDYSFYNNMAKAKEHSFDEKKFSEYFSLERTLAGMLSTYSRLFGLRFLEIPRGQYTQFGPYHIMTWHEEVLVYSVWNDGLGGGEFAGYLYLDLFPRDKKYNHAGHYGLQAGYITSAGDRFYPSSALVMNLPKPQPNKPILLAHNDIRSLFHELGHAVHNLVSQTKYAIFHGTSTSRDFIEIPAIMLENWWWTPSVIKELGYHYSYISDEFLQHWKDGGSEGSARPSEQLDDKIVENLLKTRHSSEALAVLKQCHLAIFDMAVHSTATHQELENMNLSELWNKMNVEVTMMSGLEDEEGWDWGHGCARFGAINRGYDAGYFAYPLGKAYAQDLFRSMFEKGPMSGEMGMRFRRTVLEPGGRRNGMTLLEDFLGRKPNVLARYKELGL